MPVTEQDIDRAVEALHAGGLIVFPTETVYGLGADARNAAAVRRVFHAKERPAARAMTVHLGRDADPDEWAVQVPFAARRLMREFWPGPLTVVLRSRPDVLEIVRGGSESVGLRVPDEPTTLEVLRRFGGGIVGSSANRHGGPSPTTATHAVSALGDALDAERDVVLDAGPCRLGVDSTVVDFSGEVPVVRRIGSLAVESIEETAGRPFEVALP